MKDPPPPLVTVRTGGSHLIYNSVSYKGFCHPLYYSVKTDPDQRCKPELGHNNMIFEQLYLKLLNQGHLEDLRDSDFNRIDSNI